MSRKCSHSVRDAVAKKNKERKKKRKMKVIVIEIEEDTHVDLVPQSDHI